MHSNMTKVSSSHAYNIGYISAIDHGQIKHPHPSVTFTAALADLTSEVQGRVSSSAQDACAITTVGNSLAVHICEDRLTVRLVRGLKLKVG